MNSQPHKGEHISVLRSEPALPPPLKMFLSEAEKRATHACSCQVIYVRTHIRTQKTQW